MPGKVLTIVFAVVVAGALAVVSFPRIFDLELAPLFAHVIAFRGALVVIGLLLTVLSVVAVTVSRRKFGPVVFLLVWALFTAANAGVLVYRSIPASTAATPDGSSRDELTLLTWNTFGGAADAETIASVALEEGASIVALPETTDETATRVAELMGDAGSRMWSHTVSWSETLGARSTSVLVSVDLGNYRVSDDYGNTSVLPSIVVEPVSGDGPVIAAVHPVSPVRNMSSWRDDLTWVTGLCDGNDIIVMGDFNATLDHLNLGQCRDVARDAGAGALGTWPTRLPVLLSSPIDHVLTSDHWAPVRADIVDSQDQAGSDHRPVIATIQRR